MIPSPYMARRVRDMPLEEKPAQSMLGRTRMGDTMTEYARCVECRCIYDVDASDAVNPEAFCSFECQEVAD